MVAYLYTSCIQENDMLGLRLVQTFLSWNIIRSNFPFFCLFVKLLLFSLKLTLTLFMFVPRNIVQRFYWQRLHGGCLCLERMCMSCNVLGH